MLRCAVEVEIFGAVETAVCLVQGSGGWQVTAITGQTPNLLKADTRPSNQG